MDGGPDPSAVAGCADRNLSKLALARIEAARAEIRAIEAIGRLADLLGPVQDRGRFAVSKDLADRLARFEDTAWPRIRSGGREPRDTLERLLAAVAACPAVPRSWRRLLDLLPEN